MNNYIPYHIHSDYSLLDSCTKYKSYVDKAKEYNMRAIAFTEHGNVFNWIEKKLYCDENNIKYIHGCEVYLTQKVDTNNKVRDNYHTILLAKNFDGVKEINKLISKSNKPEYFYYKPRISFNDFFNISNNVIKISACLASPLNHKTDIDDDDIYEKLIKHYDFLEIQHHNNEEQKQYNIMLACLADKYNKPLIAGTDTHSLDRYKAECRSILLLAKHIPYGLEDDFDLTFKSYEDLCTMFEEQDCLPKCLWEQAIDNTNKLYEMVDDFVLDTDFKYPKLYEDDDVMYEKVLWEKFDEKVKSGIIKDEQIDNFKKALKEETRVFGVVGMKGFMLFMSELICWCHDNNIPTGFGRGSVAGSRVAYVLDIIDVNPESWDTNFARFCNEDRLEIGDIDIDLPTSDRPKVYEYIINKFGKDKTAFVLTNGTISDKATIDEIGRGLSYKWELEHPNVNKSESDNPFSLSKIVKVKSDFASNPDKARNKYPEIFYFFDGMLDTIISKGQHPAGIVVSPITLDDNYGFVKNADGDNVLQVDMENIHEISLVKYDLLGLKNIEIIKDVYKMLGQTFPKSHEINWDDENVWNDLLKSKVGIFQFESDFAFQSLCKLKPKSIFDMSKLTAAIRPSGKSYRDELFAHKKHNNPSELIDKLLKESDGFLCIEENELINTKHGKKRIKDIQAGEEVYTTNGLESVNKVMNNGIKDVYELKTLYGSVKCTKDHRILTENGWKEYQDIKVGECVAMYSGSESYNLKPYLDTRDNIHYHKVESKEYIGERVVYDLEINNTHNFLVNGIVVHNCYQEDIIKFLQKICGLSGSEADTVRRGIARKKEDVLQKAMPSILNGYCNSSDKPREVAEEEAKEFLQIIKDASSYMFGYNHSISYCMISYLCGYLRYYHPYEFITSYLKNANNEEDIADGTQLAMQYGIKIVPPLFGVSKEDYVFDKERRVIAKGISSIKYLNKSVSQELDTIYSYYANCSFLDLLKAISEQTSVNSRQLDILIKLDYFKEYGNSNELLYIVKMFNFFKQGNISTLSKTKLEQATNIWGDVVREVVEKYATDKNDKGKELKSYKILDCCGLMYEFQQMIYDKHMYDMTFRQKIAVQKEFLGYVDLVTGKEEDRSKLVILNTYKLAQQGKKPWGYAIEVQSIGSGIKNRFTIRANIFEMNPVNKGEIIKVGNGGVYKNNKGYWYISKYTHVDE